MSQFGQNRFLKIKNIFFKKRVLPKIIHLS